MFHVPWLEMICWTLWFDRKVFEIGCPRVRIHIFFGVARVLPVELCVDILCRVVWDKVAYVLNVCLLGKPFSHPDPPGPKKQVNISRLVAITVEPPPSSNSLSAALGIVGPFKRLGLGDTLRIPPQHLPSRALSNSFEQELLV